MNTLMDLRKKRILIIGSNGKLGSSLAYYFSRNADYETLCAGAGDTSYVEGVEYEKIDITKRNNVKALFHEFFPDVVINSAGFTNVDLCETSKEFSWNINVKGTENIAMLSWAIDAHMIHFSSDYIFDGKEGPYSEDDVPNPISYYGRTKLAAENSLRSSGTRFTIFRTNVLYGSVNRVLPDFVKWVIESLKMGKEIKIVNDQINNPTFIGDLVSCVVNSVQNDIQGIYHIGGPELLSRIEFARLIARYFKLDENLLIPVTTAELKQPALRPLKSGLVYKKAAADFNYMPTSFEDTFRFVEEHLEF
jgi:dTDP-4-dehydrorhamnose reductase